MGKGRSGWGKGARDEGMKGKGCWDEGKEHPV